MFRACRATIVKDFVILHQLHCFAVLSKFCNTSQEDMFCEEEAFYLTLGLHARH